MRDVMAPSGAVASLMRTAVAPAGGRGQDGRAPQAARTFLAPPSFF